MIIYKKTMKKKLTINLNFEIDKKDISLLSKGITNAYVAYKQIIDAIELGLEPQINSNSFTILKKANPEDLANQLKLIYNLGIELMKLERKVDNKNDECKSTRD